MKATKMWAQALGSGMLALTLVGCDAQVSQPAQQSQGISSAPSLAHQVTQAQVQQEAKKGEASLARNFYFVFDGSGSMDGYCRGSSSKIYSAKTAVQSFMGVVPTTNCNLGLYVFDRGGTREVVKLGPDNRAALGSAVQNMQTGGSTPLGRAMTHGVQQLVAQQEKQLGYGEYRLVVVTDGECDSGNVAEMRQAIKTANSKGIAIYTIGLCIGQEHELRKYSISYRAADDSAQLQSALKETLGETEVFDSSSFEGVKPKK